MAAAATPTGFASDPAWQAAEAHLLAGRIDAARAAWQALRAQRPDDAHTHLLAAQLAWREDRIRDATQAALDAARAAPADAAALVAVAGVLLETGQSVAARACLANPALADCTDARMLMQAAALWARLDQHAESLALLERVGGLGHATAAFRFRLGEALLRNGRLADAETQLAASLAAAPAHGSVAVPLVRLRRQTPSNNHLDLLERSMQRVAPGSREAAALEFARYRTFEDLGRYDAAWAALERGNALMYARLRDTARDHHAWLERYLAACASMPAPAATPAEGPQPIFIVGVARSGTTLLERMLGNHPAVALAGELNDFGAQLHWLADTRNAQSDALLARLPNLDCADLGRRYLAQTQWRAHGRPFYVDKQPPNWVLAGLIHASLPSARILHLVRDPMDTCFSNWRAYFGDACAYSYDQAALAEYFGDYRRVMDHWHRTLPGTILDVAYADLVHDPEATLRRVFDFCGLPREPGCADITRNAAPSATLSAAQIRTPLHARAFGEWRRYEARLEPLRLALGALPPRAASPHGQP